VGSTLGHFSEEGHLLLTLDGGVQHVVVRTGWVRHYRKTTSFRRPALFPTVPRVPSEIGLFPTATSQPSEISLFPTAHHLGRRK
jgi:hypothetical protein